MIEQSTPVVLTHFVEVADISAEQAIALLDRARLFEVEADAGITRTQPMRSVIQLLFFEDSTRTRTSFEAAARRLGCDVCLVTEKGSSAAKGETLDDTVITLLNTVDPDVVVMRHRENHSARHISQQPWNTAGIANAGDGTNEHPTQALLDALTLRGHFRDHTGDLAGLHVVIVGDIVRSRVARSNAHLLTKLGAQVTVVAPSTMLPEDIDLWPVAVASDLDVVIGDADAVMALRIQHERIDTEAGLESLDYRERFGLTVERAARMKPGAVVMHPGPMNRGVEIDDAVADGPRSLIRVQVRNGVWARMAVVEALIAGRHAR